MAQTVADQMVEVLAAAGVQRVYGVVGDSLNGFTDAMLRRGGIQWMHVRHEEVAAFAAGADAHVTGQPRRLRRQLRPRQSASHQRSLRLPAHARAGGGDRGANPLRGDRFALLPGDASRAPVPGMLELLRARVESRADAARARDRGAPVDPGTLRERRRRSRRRGAKTGCSVASAEARRTCAGGARDHAVG